MTEKQEWRDVAGWEGLYQVSNDGRLRACERPIPYPDGSVKTRRGKEIVVTTCIRKRGYTYPHVTLRCQGRMQTLRLHRLVAMAFIPNPLNLPMVNHMDGNKRNNSVANLEWTTCSLNHRHSWATGLRSRAYLSGERNQHAKLTYERVTAARLAYRDGATTRGLARANNVSQATMQSALAGRTWRVNDASQ